MHIGDWDESFLSRLDPESYASHAPESGNPILDDLFEIPSWILLFANFGGKVHAGLGDRDILG
jgi:hypothetical protein